MFPISLSEPSDLTFFLPSASHQPCDPSPSPAPALLTAYPPTPTSWQLWDPELPSAPETPPRIPSFSLPSTRFPGSNPNPASCLDPELPTPVAPLPLPRRNARNLSQLARISVDLVTLANAISELPATPPGTIGTEFLPPAGAGLEFSLAFEQTLTLLFRFRQILQELGQTSPAAPEMENRGGAGGERVGKNGNGGVGEAGRGWGEESWRAVDSGTWFMVAACYSHWLAAATGLLRVAAGRLTGAKLRGGGGEGGGGGLEFPSMKFGALMVEMPARFKACAGLEMLERAVECVGGQILVGDKEGRGRRSRLGGMIGIEGGEEAGIAMERTMGEEEEEVLKLIRHVRQLLTASTG